MSDEFAAVRAVQRFCALDGDAELVGPVGCALADAFDFGRVHGIDFLPHWFHRRSRAFHRLRQRGREHAFQLGPPLILRAMSRAVMPG